jgi:hypothetical protein
LPSPVACSVMSASHSRFAQVAAKKAPTAYRFNRTTVWITSCAHPNQRSSPCPCPRVPPAEGFGPAQDRSAPRATSQVTPRQPLPHFTTVAQSRGNSREPAGRSGNPLPTKNDPDPGKAPGQGHKSRRVGLYAGESRRGAMTCPNVQGGRFRGYVGGYARRAPPRSAPSRWLRRPPRSEGLDGLEIVRVRPLGHSGKCASRQAVR